MESPSALLLLFTIPYVYSLLFLFFSHSISFFLFIPLICNACITISLFQPSIIVKSLYIEIIYEPFMFVAYLFQINFGPLLVWFPRMVLLRLFSLSSPSWLGPSNHLLLRNIGFVLVLFPSITLTSLFSMPFHVIMIEIYFRSSYGRGDFKGRRMYIFRRKS